MGNIHASFVNEPCAIEQLQNCGTAADERVLLSVDYEQWRNTVHKEFDFPKPCHGFHDDDALPYSMNNCYMLETSGSRRRMNYIRCETSRYIADIDSSQTGNHSIHIRDLMTSAVTVIPLAHAASNIPELDYMLDPVLEVIAYHGSMAVVSVRGRTKRTASVIIFVDFEQKLDIGFYSVNVNVNNLNSTMVDCMVSQDGQTFVITVCENHYDEFELHFHALRIDDNNQLRHISDATFGRACWYEPAIQLAFLPTHDGCSDKIVALGEFPNHLTLRGRLNCLLVYDLSNKCVDKTVIIDDKLYPKSVACSPDGERIAVLCRQFSESWCTNVDCYTVQIYSSNNLYPYLQVNSAFSLQGYNLFANCSRVAFSNGSQLIAVGSSTWSDCWNTGEFEVLMAGSESEHTQLTLYRLPPSTLSLKHSCRDAILANCDIRQVADLPLPNALIQYLRYH